jgi:hypothetical protein
MPRSDHAEPLMRDELESITVPGSRPDYFSGASGPEAQQAPAIAGPEGLIPPSLKRK